MTPIRTLTSLIVWSTCVAAMTPAAFAASATQTQIETTLTAAVSQVTEQYVDPVDTRMLVSLGLRGLMTPAPDTSIARLKSMWPGR